MYLVIMWFKRYLNAVRYILYVANQKIQLRMFNKLKANFYDLSKNTFGCRVMQKLIEYTYNREDL